MKTILKFLLFLLLTSCVVEKKKEQPPLDVRVWKPTAEFYCTPNVTPGIELPFDFFVLINRTNLEFGRYDGLASMRTFVVHNDTHQPIGDLSKPFETGIIGTKWSSDGSKLYYQSRWEDPQNAMYEEALHDQVMDMDKYLLDLHEFNLNTGQNKNITEIDRVSNYNAGPMTWYPDLDKLVINAYVNNEMRLFLMNADGSDKHELASTGGFTYGYNSSPDGTKYAFNSDYKVYIGDVVTRKEIQVQTSCPFNFAPDWLPDSSGIIFVCGEHSTGDLYYADRNGNNIKLIGARKGYKGAIPFIEAFDFHEGGSDTYATAPDSQKLIFGAVNGNAIDLYINDLITGQTRNLTNSKDGAWNGHPQISTDGNFVIFTSMRTGIRDVYMINLNTLAETKITNLLPGCGSYYPKWRPNQR